MYTRWRDYEVMLHVAPFLPYSSTEPQQLEPRLAARDYTEAMHRLAALRPTVDQFFDSVLVMAEEPDLRANRLALLRRIRELFLRVADLSRLPGQAAA